MEAAYPETEETPEAAEGTAAHWVALDCMLLAGRVPAVDSVAPNGQHVTAEMIEAAQLVYDDVVNTLGPNWRQMIVVEQRVTIPRVHPQNWGTPDIRAWQQLPDGRWMLHIWDFKYGHKLVEAFENWQCIDYGSGALSEAKMDDGLSDQNTFLSICVIQPRAFHRDGTVRRWKVRASDLRGHINRLRMSAEEAVGPNPKCYPEPEACENCRGRHGCEALQRTTYRAMQIGYAAQPLEISPHAVGLELRMIERAEAFLKARKTGLQEHATSLIKRGQPVAFYALESAEGRLKWDKPTAEVLMLGQLAGVNLAAPVEPITPTQAKKLAPALATTIDAFSSRPVGASKLVQDDGSKARRIFSAPT
jgi:hypothetical protein